MPAGRVIGAVLAAGAGRRMGVPKAGLRVDGVRLIDRAVRVLRAGGCAEVLAVTRAGVAAAGARILLNPDPDRGMRSSLALAVAAGSDLGAEAIAVILVDTPGITADAVGAVLAGWQPGRIAVGSYTGRRGHPTVMAPGLWLRALQLAGPDEGARALLAAEPQLVDEVVVSGSAIDLDRPEDLAAWTARRRGGGTFVQHTVDGYRKNDT